MGFGPARKFVAGFARVARDLYQGSMSTNDATGLILRRWSAVIRTADRAAYAAYIADTGGSDYTATPGNRGYQMTMRDLGDGTTEVATLSWWTSLGAIHAFAGEDIAIARYYPEDDRFLLTRPEHVEHHQIVAGGPGGIAN